VQGIILGVLFGAFMGLFGALDTGSLLAGLVGGLSSGLLFGFFMGVVVARRNAVRAPLSPTERRAIVSAVQSGGEPSDPALAPAIIEHAQQLRRTQPLERQSKWVFGFFLVLSAYLAIAAFVTGNLIGGGGWTAAVLFWLVLPRRVRRMRERAVERATAAEEQARRTMRHGDG
jgi:hypothetical protein